MNYGNQSFEAERCIMRLAKLIREQKRRFAVHTSFHGFFIEFRIKKRILMYFLLEKGSRANHLLFAVPFYGKTRILYFLWRKSNLKTFWNSHKLFATSIGKNCPLMLSRFFKARRKLDLLNIKNDIIEFDLVVKNSLRAK